MSDTQAVITKAEITEAQTVEVPIKDPVNEAKKLLEEDKKRRLTEFSTKFSSLLNEYSLKVTVKVDLDKDNRILTSVQIIPREE